MSSDTAADTPDVDATDPVADEVEKQAFLDRLGKESVKRKDAEKKASELEKRLAQLESDMHERESANLPELEQQRKRAEKLEQQLADAEKAREQSDQRVIRTQREQWIAAAAAEMNFANPARAARLVDDLDSIEDPTQAQRAVKALAKTDSYLIKNEEPQLPGRVLANGRTATNGRTNVPGDKAEEEGRMLLDGINSVLQQGFMPAGEL